MLNLSFADHERVNVLCLWSTLKDFEALNSTCTLFSNLVLKDPWKRSFYVLEKVHLLKKSILYLTQFCV